MALEILGLLLLILLNGFLAMGEVALLTARKPRLQAMARRGDRGAVSALALHDEPTRFLSTIQVGITAIGILSGIVGEAALADPLGRQLERAGLAENTAMMTATVLVVALVTYLAVVVGELVPKRLGQLAPEAIARRVARLVQVLSTAGRPFVRLLSGSTHLVLRVLGTGRAGPPTLTEEEIHALLDSGSRSGEILEQERTMVRNVFHLDDRPASSLMTPRADVVAIDLRHPPEENLARLLSADHTRYPVCRGGLEDVVGILGLKAVFERLVRGESPDFESGLQPALFVPETLSGLELLERFRSASAHMAIVVDEYGHPQGIVTPHDLLAAIAGDLASGGGEPWAVRREDGSWLLDGTMPLPELTAITGLEELPAEESGRYATLAGMLLVLFGRIPQAGDAATWKGWRFEIMDMDGRRIDTVLAVPPPAPAPGAHAGGV